jgi:hypothetical protein
MLVVVLTEVERIGLTDKKSGHISMGSPAVVVKREEEPQTLALETL